MMTSGRWAVTNSFKASEIFASGAQLITGVGDGNVQLKNNNDMNLSLKYKSYIIANDVTFCKYS